MAEQMKRGPSYPIFGLEQAVRKAKQLFDRYGKRSVTAEEAVQEWSYGGLNGTSRRALAALRHYGLIDGSNDSIRLTADAVSIIVSPDGSLEQRDALVRAATKPKAFEVLFSAFPQDSGMPSDGAIRAFLLKDTEFGHVAAPELIGAFKETVALARLYETSDNDAWSERPTPATVENGTQANRKVTLGSPRAGSSMRSVERQAAPWALSFEYSVPGSTHPTITVSGEPPTSAAAALIGEYLDLVKKSITAAVVTLETHSPFPEPKTDDKGSGTA